MSRPKPVETLWTELESARAQVLGEAEGLEIIHLTIAESATGFPGEARS